MSNKAMKLITVPANGQISIGKSWAGKQIQIVEEKTGELHITSGTFVPDSQKIFFTEKAEKSLAEFNRYEKESKPTATNTKSLFAELKKKKK